MIEAAHVHRTGERPQRALTQQIEVDVEVAQRQFAQCAVDRLAVAASGVIRFRDRAPVALDAIDGNDVVGVAHYFQVHHQRRISVGAQRGGSQHGAFKTMRGVFPQHSARRPRGVGKVVGHGVQKFLDAVRIFQTAQLAQFFGREAGDVGFHCVFRSLHDAE